MMGPGRGMILYSFAYVRSHSSAHKNQKHDDLTALKRMIITVVTVEGETTWGSLDSFALSAASKTPAKKRVRRSETALETARRTFVLSQQSHEPVEPGDCS